MMNGNEFHVRQINLINANRMPMAINDFHMHGRNANPNKLSNNDFGEVLNKFAQLKMPIHKSDGKGI